MNGFVYVVGPEAGPFKVGIAKDVAKRLAAIQTGCPYPLKVHFTLEAPNALKVEKAAHRKLLPFGTSGEWFNAPLETVIAAVKNEEPAKPSPDAPMVMHWLYAMKSAGLARSDAECADLLGVTESEIAGMKERGADRRTALACRALLHRLQPYGE